MSNALEQALEHVEPQDDVKPDQLAAELASLEARRKECLPIEVELIESLDGQIAERKNRLKTLKRSTSMTDYPVIHLSTPMEWESGGTGLPRLGIFRFDKTELKIRHSNFWGFAAAAILPGVAILICLGAIAYDKIFGAGVAVDNLLIVGSIALAVAVLLLATWFFTSPFRTGVFPRLPRVLRNYYHIHAENLSSHLGNRLSVEYTCWLPSGVVPEEAKAEINKAKEVFGEKNIFYVAEAKWARTSRPERRTLDPIVIGLKDDVTYLITSFDMTPLEQAVEGEFTEKPVRNWGDGSSQWNENW